MLRVLKKLALPVAILSIAVLVVVGLGALKKKPEEEQAEIPALVVNTVQAELVSQSVRLKFQGEVRAKTDIDLVTQVTGKVTRVSDAFIEGGEFKAGEVLLEVDDADYQVALKSAEAAVAAAQVDLDVELAAAATNAKEWRELQGRPIEEANPLRLNKPQVDRAKSKLNAAKAQLAAAKLSYDRTKISAPFDGRIKRKSAELGKFLSRGESIGQVFATDAMEIRIPMTDIQLGELGVRMGYSSELVKDKKMPATVSVLFGIHRHEWQGYLKSVDASIDQKTRLLFATIVVDEPFDKFGDAIPLVPGLFVDVELASSASISGLKIPRNALRNSDMVYVYKEDELKQKKVNVLFTSDQFVIVQNANASSLEAIDRVITSSVPGAFDGMAVSLKNAVTEPELNAAVEQAESMPEEGAATEGASLKANEVEANGDASDPIEGATVTQDDSSRALS